MAKMFYITVKWEKDMYQNDEQFDSMFGDDEEVYYDGYFIYRDDQKMVGYTHNGILTGESGVIMEVGPGWSIAYPIKVQTRSSKYTYPRGNTQIIMRLEEKPYTKLNEKLILERTIQKSKAFTEEVQNALQKYLN